MSPRYSLSGGLAAGLVLTILLSGTAAGQVIEIAPDGAVATYAGPSVYSDAGVTPLATPRMPVSAGGMEIDGALEAAARRHDLDPDLLKAVAWRESGGRQGAISPKGAVGVMQLMPATARSLGVDPSDLSQNIEGGAAYLRQMLDRFGEVELALAAYNAGPQAVEQHGGTPPYPETQQYVTAILSRLDRNGAVSNPTSDRRRSFTKFGQ